MYLFIYDVFDLFIYLLFIYSLTFLFIITYIYYKNVRK